MVDDELVAIGELFGASGSAASGAGDRRAFAIAYRFICTDFGTNLAKALFHRIGQVA